MRYYKSAYEFDETELLEKMNYKNIMSVLIRAKKVKLEDEWKLIKMNPSQIEILQKLDLLPKSEELPKRKRGRPKGSKNKLKTA